MATHQITFTDAQEKGLAYVTERRNAELALEKPPTSITADEYLQSVFASVADDWAKQAGIAVADPIIEKLKEAIATADDAKVQAVKDALGIVEVKP